jgi:hypothetical protein
METHLIKIMEAFQQQARRCETIAQDKTQESLTGAPAEKSRNEQAAREWLVKSAVWREAEKIAREMSQATPEVGS